MKALVSALLLSVLVSSLSACSIYRLGTRQGTEVTAEKRTELSKALTREQVREIMGTPLLQDPFRDDRWDYVFYFQKHKQATQLRRISVFFNGDLVDRIEDVNVDNAQAEDLATASEKENQQFKGDTSSSAAKASSSAQTGSDEQVEAP